MVRTDSNSKANNEDDNEEAVFEAKLEARRELYKRHYSGLQAAYGPSGLPKLECLLDAAQQAKARMARHSPLAIGASVLTSGNRIFASCTIESLHDAKYTICAERAALLKALGEDPGHVVTAMAICSDQKSPGLLPSPCGSCREFMAEFGDFPVFLVNESGDSEETRSFELFPRARQLSTAKVQQSQQQQQHKSQQGQSTGCNGTTKPTKALQCDGDLGEDDTSRGDDPPVNVRDWTVQHVRRWLIDSVEMPQYVDIFQRSAIDGCTLLHLQDCDLQLLLGILQPLHRRRLLLHIDRLKDRELLEHGIDYGQLQDYLAVLDRDRIAIVAVLKATFDRLDQNKDGYLDFHEVRQALSAMQCDASAQAVETLLRGKLLRGDASDSEGRVAFEDFAAAFSSLAMQPASEEVASVHSTETQWELPVVDISGLRGTFEKADRNKSGGIDEQELVALFQALQKGNELSTGAAQKKAREWFAAADFDGDDRLSFAEFLVRYVQLKALDISKLKLFFEASEPLESTHLKPMGVLQRALGTFFPAFTSSEISVWYKRHLNSHLLRNVDIEETVKQCPPATATEPTDQSASKPTTTATRTSLTISYADFVLAVFLFQDHTKDRRVQLRELHGKLSNDALVHKSRIVLLQQTGHVRMCPQTIDAAEKSQSLAEIRRAQQQQKRRAGQKSRADTSDNEDDAKYGSDDDDIAASARKQKRRLAKQLARVDTTFDRFARAKAKKKGFCTTSERESKESDSENSDNAQKKCELNAMETAQAMTELGVACPRDQMLRLLKDEGFGIHDCVDQRAFRHLVQHFQAQSESALGSFPAHRRPKMTSISIWDEDAEHAKKMAHMAALLSGEYGKHRNREDYDEYLRFGSDDRNKNAKVEVSSTETRKPWKKEMVRFHTEKESQKHRKRDDNGFKKKKAQPQQRRPKQDREEAKGDSSDSSSSEESDNTRSDSEDSRSRRRDPQRSKRCVSKSRSRSQRRRSASRRIQRKSHSSTSSFSSTETTESECEELHRHHQAVLQQQRGFEIGDRVFSRGGDGRGTLIRLYRDYFVADVHFDSGKKAKNVDLAKLRRLDPFEDADGALNHRRKPQPVLRVGARVAVSHKGTKTTRKGRVTLCRLDGTFDIRIDELGEQETLKRVQAKYLRVLGKPVVYIQGTSVKVKQRHEYLRGRVTVCRVDGTYDVQLRRTDKSVLKRVDVDLLSPDDDDDEEDEEEEDNKERDDAKEDRNRNRVSTQKRRSAKSDSDDNEEKHNDESDNKYDDFEPEFAKGERVEARFQGKGAFYPGKITRVLSDGTFDVIYDDGDEETRVKSHLIRAVKGAGRDSKATATTRNTTNQTRAREQDDYGDDGFESS